MQQNASVENDVERSATWYEWTKWHDMIWYGGGLNQKQNLS
jgi:hypothetical protein